MQSDRRNHIQTSRVVQVGLAAVISVAALLVLRGCPHPGKSVHVAEDQRVARQVSAAVLAGSFQPVQDSVATEYREQFSDSIISALGVALRRRFGASKQVAFVEKDIQPIYTDGVWQVQSEHANYQMKLRVNSEGKVSWIAFRLSPQANWESALAIGADELRRSGQH